MRSASAEFKRLVGMGAARYDVKVELAISGVGKKMLTGSDIMENSLSITEAVSSSSSFDVGAAVIGSASFSLNNWDGRFDDWTFDGAVANISIGLPVNGATEWVKMGKYVVEQPSTYGTVISLECSDFMSRFEYVFDEDFHEFPESLLEMAIGICDECDMTLASYSFANCEYTVESNPSDDQVTCLQMLSYIAQVSGNWARVDENGELIFEWYDTSAFEMETWSDGGEFDDANPYATGDAADGGSFMDGGETVDGGSFDNARVAVLQANSSLTVGTDDVVITGVKVSEYGDKTWQNKMYGNIGYMLEISENPLVQEGRAKTIAENIGKRVVGMRFRAFDATTLNNPVLQAGDPVIVIDAAGRQYRSYASSHTWKMGAYDSVSMTADPPQRNKATSYSAMTKAVVEARNAVQKERTSREKAVADLAEKLASSSGLYMTQDKQSDGSTIYYMHDKPVLGESKVVWKMTADALGISTDGGKTYPYGLDATGTAILDRIYTVGIDATYINTGLLKDKSALNSWDLKTGKLVAGDIEAHGKFNCGQDYIDGYRGIKLTDTGEMEGYWNGNRVGYIDYTASSRDVDTGDVYRGIQIQAEGIVRISSPLISVSGSSDRSVRTTDGFTGTISQPIVSEVHDNGGGSIGWTYGTLQLTFINGLLTGYSTVG